MYELILFDIINKTWLWFLFKDKIISFRACKKPVALRIVDNILDNMISIACVDVVFRFYKIKPAFSIHIIKGSS